ncbi:metallophosphoesterase family protein [Deinococcus maricopensis]|uniref:Nuclease SbcCD subunit D n=1 Tax=Deinococcus maricopensis (strain DSM 21211 / LMG 22137 / NRRL B-23946 / LB-34) TaxID=709986 RepID=E8U871_DEIML|nr:exonuclease SbcCD subunit D [Deinococcus maricopensis]ADV67260.1 nuclease SbcCD, D subunit [Deinococcus maricopensis DSM 21211]
MRVLHTADFHAGRTLRGVDRTPEIHAALTEIADLARTERADAVLVSGDLFDSVNPSADAEAAIFQFFLALRDAGIPSIVIAGNHDSANRLASLSGLLGWVGVQMVAQVGTNPQALVRTITARDGTTLTVGALPYLSERRLIRSADLLGQDVGAWRQRYREGINFFLRQLERGFRGDTVNMLMMHATLDGSTPSGSERSFLFDLTNAYTISPLQLPASAQYVALGHVHKAQQPGEAPPAYYPGSVIQLDFGEAGERKQVNLVEVEPGRPARVHALPLSAGRELRTVRATLDTLDRKLESVQGFGGLVKVIIEAPGGTAMPGLKDRVLRATPNAIAVDLERVGEGTGAAPSAREGVSMTELFTRYYEARKGAVPPALLDAFREADAAAQPGEDEAVSA